MAASRPAIALLVALMLLLAVCGSAGAQPADGRYTVVAGDTLAEIATRFGVPLDTLVQVNEIADPGLIQVGRQLIIPNPDGTLPLSAIRTVPVQARPGESPAGVAARYGADPGLLGELNGLPVDARLFPGQTIAMPADAIGEEGIHFGAVTDVRIPDAVSQGRTGRLEITSARPLSLTVRWNDLPVPLTPAAGDDTARFGFVPAPALIAPGFYPLTIAYTTTRGVPVERTWTVVIAPGEYATESIIVSEEVSGLLAPELVAAELAMVTELWSHVSPDLVFQERFSRPVSEEYSTSSPFGTRRAYGGGAVNGYHSGLDYSAPAGAEVTAPAPGRVVMARPLAVRGNAVLLDHGRGIFTGYWHLSELQVEEGRTVAAGDVLGLVGTTGLSTGNHLHWELRIYGVAVDPMQFLTEQMVPQADAGE